MNRDVSIIVTGPTAVGKSDVALDLAERVQGEIINVDSMQVYRGMNVGTAKPSREERERVPHHLIDVAACSEAFDASRFVRLALDARTRILARGRVPIFCGGTGFYLKALQSGLGTAPAPEPALRAKLSAAPLATLIDELKRSDPETYRRIDLRNPRRVIRAVEVLRSTGESITRQQSPWESPWRRGFGPGECLAVGLNRDRTQLHARINNRVDRMFEGGLVDETAHLLECGLEQNPTALQAIGYRQVTEFLRGKGTLEATIAEVKTRTRQLARRQMTWFHRQMALDWIEVTDAMTPGDIRERIERAYRSLVALHGDLR